MQKRSPPNSSVPSQDRGQKGGRPSPSPSCVTGVQAAGGVSKSTRAFGEKVVRRSPFIHLPGQKFKSDNAKYSRIWENRSLHTLLEKCCPRSRSGGQFAVFHRAEETQTSYTRTHEGISHVESETFTRIFAAPPFVRKPNDKTKTKNPKIKNKETKLQAPKKPSVGEWINGRTEYYRAAKNE